jgi:uncharacterized protein (TIGR02271 family)
MIGKNDVRRLEGATAFDRTGEKIGKVGQLYVDDATGEPAWVTVSTGWFGMSESFVPLKGADFEGDDIRLAYDKDTVKDAPRVDAGVSLEPDREQELDRHYKLGAWQGAKGGKHGKAAQERGKTERERGKFDTEHKMTLSEERLAAGKERVEAGRARLRKYTTQHTETVEVPVTKENLVVERTPASGKAKSHPIEDSGEKVEDITLHEERPVVGKETVPVEDVHVGKQQVTETERVSGEVRKEHADVDVNAPKGRARGEAGSGRKTDHRR